MSFITEINFFVGFLFKNLNGPFFEKFCKDFYNNFFSNSNAHSIKKGTVFLPGFIHPDRKTTLREKNRSDYFTAFSIENNTLKLNILNKCYFFMIQCENKMKLWYLWF